MKDLNLAEYIESRQRKGIYYFLRCDAIQALACSPAAFKLAVQRLIKKGQVRQVRGDFFIVVPPEYAAFQSLPAAWFMDDYMKHCRIPYYIGLLSAAALHGASPQQPMICQVMVNKPLRPITLGKVSIQFHFNKWVERMPTELSKTETGYWNVSTVETTLIDLVRYMSSAGQINNVATIFLEWRDQIKIDRLNEMIESGMVEVATVQRLGYLMEFLDLQLPVDRLASYLKRNCSPHLCNKFSKNT